MLKKELERELNRTKLILDYAREEIKEKDKEIERLRLELSGYRQAILQDKEMLGLKQENERLHSIIKEVRECVETAISEDYYDGEIYKINEIIDKINKENI